MSNEATIQSYLTIRKGTSPVTLNYTSQPAQFRADVTGTKGPSPGAITCTTGGTDISFTQLTQPALCRIMNMDDTNFITVGIWDPDSSLFYPLMELLPGETYVIRLSRDVGEEYQGSGTGTGTANNTLRIKANTASCVVLIEAFES